MRSYSFSLLMLVTVFVGTACGCNFERMFRSPRYEEITQPKRILTIPRAHGVCVASDGKFAVIPYNRNGNFYIFYSCGKLMKIARLPFGDRSNLVDCTFSGNNLYVASHTAKKMYKYTENGKFKKVIATGERFQLMTSCQGRLYVTTDRKNSRNVISYYNDKETHRLNVPGSPRGIVIGLDDNLYVTAWHSNKVLSYKLNGKLLGTKTYKGLSYADGIAVDKAGNFLIADYSNPNELLVYSPCGELIKQFRAGFRRALDVDIGNDGTVMLTDPVTNKVYMY